MSSNHNTYTVRIIFIFNKNLHSSAESKWSLHRLLLLPQERFLLRFSSSRSSVLGFHNQASNATEICLSRLQRIRIDEACSGSCWVRSTAFILLFSTKMGFKSKFFLYLINFLFFCLKLILKITCFIN